MRGRISQFSPASFLFQGARKTTTGNRATGSSGVTGAQQTSSGPTSFGSDTASLNGNTLSLGDQMRNLKAKVGKASGNWLEKTKRDLGFTAPESKEFQSKFQDRGWDVKGKENRAEFQDTRGMDGKTVAFRVKDEATGEMVEKKGVLRSHNFGEDGDPNSFHLVGQKGSFDSRNLHDMAVNNQDRLPPGRQQFRDKFEDKGWQAKHERNQNDFAPEGLHGREVAFQAKDPETGKMREHRGIMEADPDPARGAMFKLKGQEGEFNNNQIKEMAVNNTFDKGYKKDGWSVKSEQHPDAFHPQNIHGHEVAFRTKDPETGKMVERKGVMKASQEPGDTSFTLQGQNGKFNAADIPEMALNDKFGKEYRDKGWIVKDQQNADMFHPDQMDGRQVAFRHPDPETHQMMDHMGKAQMITGALSVGMSLFTLVGMSSMFNSSMMPEMAINPMGMEGMNLDMAV